MKKSRLLGTMLTCIFVSVSSSTNAASIVSSTFDSDLDGWTKSSASIINLTYVANGGNPGGYIQSVDTGPTEGVIIAPSKFLGDWSSLNGNDALSWDFKLIDPGTSPGAISELRASISGPGGSATFFSGITPVLGSWINIDAPIIESAWTIQTGSWVALLSDVTQLGLNMDVLYSGGVPGDMTGIDNVVLSGVPGVPIPASVWLFGSGLLGLIGIARRKQAA